MVSVIPWDMSAIVGRGIPLTSLPILANDAQEATMPHAAPDLTTPILYPIGWLLLVIWFGFIGVTARRLIRQARDEAAKKATRVRRSPARRDEA